MIAGENDEECTSGRRDEEKSLLGEGIWIQITTTECFVADSILIVLGYRIWIGIRSYALRGEENFASGTKDVLTIAVHGTQI